MGIDGSEGWGYDGRVDTEMWEVELVIFIGGVSQGQKILSEGLVRLCGSCGEPWAVSGDHDVYVF